MVSCKKASIRRAEQLFHAGFVFTRAFYDASISFGKVELDRCRPFSGTLNNTSNSPHYDRSIPRADAAITVHTEYTAVL